MSTARDEQRLTTLDHGKRWLRPVLWPVRRALWRARVGLYARTGQFARLRRAQSGGVRILTYHGVHGDEATRPSWIPRYFVSESQLDQQLAWLRQAGPIIAMDEARDILSETRRRAPLAFVLTFDDGYYNNLSRAAPILAAHAAPATAFLTTGPIDAGGAVPTWIQGRILGHLAARAGAPPRRRRDDQAVVPGTRPRRGVP